MISAHRPRVLAALLATSALVAGALATFAGAGTALGADEEAFLTPEQMLTETSAGIYAPIRQTGGIDLAGDFGQWEQYTGIALPAKDSQNKVNGWTGPADLSAKAYFAHDAANFYLGVQVTDDTHHPLPGGNNWQGDGIQFAFGDTAFGSFRTEYGVALGDDGQPDIARYSDGQASDPPSAIQMSLRQDGNVTTYALRIPWTAAMQGAPAAGQLVPFTLLVNDNDGSGRDGYIEWTRGIGDTKDIGLFARTERLAASDTWTAWLAGPAQVDAGTSAQLTLLVPNYADTSLPVTIDIPAAGVAGEQVTVPANQALRKTFTVTVAETTDIRATIAAGGRTRELTQHVVALKTAEELRAMFDQLENTALPRLRGKLAAAHDKGIATDYETVDAATIEEFVPHGRDDIDHSRLDRAEYIADSLQTLDQQAETALDAYLDGSRKPLRAPRYVTGKAKPQGYSMLGTTTSGENQPILFTGYGMFDRVRRDVAKFPKLGTNLVDYNFGPVSVIKPPVPIANWYTWTGGSATFTADTASPHAGSYAFKFANVSGPGYATQSVPVTPNQTYTFSAWVKGEGLEGATIVSKNWGFVYGLPTGTYDWQHVTFEVPAGSDSSLEFLVFTEKPGTLWLDDASITAPGSTTNLLKNGDFEAGLSDEPFSVDKSEIENVLLPMLEEAEENNVAVNLDLSPHYWPSWTFDTWPDLRNPDNLFANTFDIEHPMTKQIVDAFLDAVIPAVKDSPALQSVTLTSEPIYVKNNGAYHRQAWHDWLAKEFDSVAQLNARYDTSYDSIADVPVPNVDDATGNALSYDYLTFKSGRFQAYHQALADRIHTWAPDLPTHAKIMGWGARNRSPLLTWGIDVEDFSNTTEISGNDSGNAQESGPAGYLDYLMLYDQQASFAKQPVFNSEDHVITDGDERYIPEIATSAGNGLWAGALHGRTLSSLWVWDRSYDTVNQGYLMGSILNRPDAVSNVGRVSLDLNRLAKQVTAFQNAPASVAVLYGFTPNLYSGSYLSAMRQSYGALSYTGQKVGFVTEDQIGRRGLDKYKLLVLPEVTNLSTSTLAAIRDWERDGGRVVTIGGTAQLLTGDEYDRAQPAALRGAVLNHPRTVKLASNPSESELREVCFDQLHRLHLDGVIVVDAATGEPATNVEWRMATQGRQRLLSLINFGEDAKQVYVTVDGRRVTPRQELISTTSPGSSTLAVDGLGHYLYVLP
ncbi:sugar-binding protein [Flindersiella endophytica]